MFGTFMRGSVGVVAVAGFLALGGCDTGPDASEPIMGFAMEASRESILAGEAVTFTTTSHNVLGRNAEIRWHATGADLETSENGRVAQATFEEPGTYAVSADLMVDGDRVQTQSQIIEVRPLRIPGEGKGTDNLK